MFESATWTPSAPVYSDLRDDAEYRELLEVFVTTVADNRIRLQACFSAGEMGALSREAHQLKGAGGGYGFPLVTELAAQLESACRRTPLDPAEIAHRLAELDDCLSRLRV